MNLGLDNPRLLPALAFALAPLVLHLLARARPPRRDFPSLFFLQRVRRETTRATRPRDWLLLALRTLLAAALAAAFLRPRLHGVAVGEEDRRQVVVVVDATASMAAANFPAACAQAAALLEGLGPADRANLVWLRAPPRAAFDSPGANLDRLREDLRAAAPSAEDGDPEAALRLAFAQIADLDGAREVVVVSDFQATQWRSLPDPPPGVRLVLLPVPGEAPAHLALAAPRARPARPLAGEEVVVSVEVHNHSDREAKVSLALDAGDWQERREITLPARARQPVVFSRLFPAPGPVEITFRLPSDAFPADDRAFLALDVRPRLVAGLLDAPGETAARWRRALSALDWVRLSSLAPADPAAGLADCDLAVLPGWTGPVIPAWRTWLESGGVLLWPVGEGVTADLLAELAPSAWAAGSAAPQWLVPSQNLRLSVALPEDSAFALFRSGSFGDPAGGELRGRWTLPAPRDGPAQVLLRYDDGAPALVRVPVGQGALLVWNIDLRPESGHWASRLEFLPLVGELLSSARAVGLGGAGSAVLHPGATLAWRPDREAAPEQVVVLDPDGQPLPISHATDALGPLLLSPPVERPGLYRWSIDGEPVAREAVNFPAGESDLRAGDPSALAPSGVAVASGAGAARARREGVPLWPWFALAAATALVLEGALAARGRKGDSA